MRHVRKATVAGEHCHAHQPKSEAKQIVDLWASLGTSLACFVSNIIWITLGAEILTRFIWGYFRLRLRRDCRSSSASPARHTVSVQSATSPNPKPRFFQSLSAVLPSAIEPSAS